MKSRTIVMICAFGVLLGGAWMAQRQYDRAPEEAAGKRPKATVEASILLQEFMEDEAAAGDKYNDKVIAVTGTVRAIGEPKGGKVSVLLETGNALAAVACEFDQAEMPRLEKGTRVTVQGYCAGYNLDVVLQRCALA